MSETSFGDSIRFIHIVVIRSATDQHRDNTSLHVLRACRVICVQVFLQSNGLSCAREAGRKSQDVYGDGCVAVHLTLGADRG